MVSFSHHDIDKLTRFILAVVQRLPSGMSAGKNQEVTLLGREPQLTKKNYKTLSPLENLAGGNVERDSICYFSSSSWPF